MSINAGPFNISFDSNQRIEAAPVAKSSQKSDAAIYKVTHRDGWSLDVAYMDFTVSRDIRCLQYSDMTPVRMHRLTHGLRMSVKSDLDLAKDWVELSQAQITDFTNPGWSKLKLAEERQLDQGSGLSVREFLSKCGAEFGTRENMIGDDSRRRRYGCATFPKKNIEIAIVCYVITRVLPHYYGFNGICTDKVA